ncbi:MULTISPECIES: serine hydrolase domain-containing protein [unclassified Sphingobium]|uniref:serine hydrolase domain-containing protein n=1 Tax=unclassified Sphingobium TaxID=2611147 RepID=UPI002223F571|nr:MULTISPECIES: serine hydrolase [unclassified Sphingobium]MCW2393789.1 CubicO group peptidase (beta-lactamase class C family) [Sphingobium sp. B8D3B]MCW2417303.1 CubicO group peptidase (beta-lactamase class C family) [Sphingobium sp. B8D3C]
MNVNLGRRIMAALLVTSGLVVAAGGTSARAQPSDEVKTYRMQMFDPPMRMLANRTLAEMFNTAPVPAGPAALELRQRLRPLDFTYEFDKKRRNALDIVERTKTDALLIMKNGEIVYEGYYNNSGEKTLFNSYSVAKSFNAIMVGLALREGKIASLTTPITTYIPEVKGSGYEGTTIRDLLEMRSGVDWIDNFMTPGNLAYDAHVASWVEEKARYTDGAKLTKPAHKPGTHFTYNSMDAALVGLVVERATGMPVSRYLSERLWRPGGMEADAFYVIDGPSGVGREFTAGGFNARLRDYGRIGQLMLNEGMLNGQRLLPPDYVKTLRQSITAETGEGLGYGYFWWTQTGTQAFSAIGGEGQFIYVDPEHKTVVVKLSHGPVGPEAVPVMAETMAFLKAAARWNPK